MGSNTQSWATGLPESYSSRWFITSWPGRYVGASDAALLFVLDSSASRCLRLFRSAPPNWEYGELAKLLNAYCTRTSTGFSILSGPQEPAWTGRHRPTLIRASR